MIIRDSIVFTLFLVLKCSIAASIAEVKANKSETECISNLNLSNPGWPGFVTLSSVPNQT